MRGVVNRRRAGYAVVAILAVLAVGLAAGALTEQPHRSGGGEVGTGEDATGPAIEFDSPAVDFVSPGRALLFLLWLMVAVAAYGVLRQPLRSLREFLRTLGAVALVMLIGWFLLLALTGGAGGGREGAGAEDNSSGGGIGGGEAEGIGGDAAEAADALAPESAVFVLLLAAMLAIGLAAAVVRRGAFRRGGGEEVPDEKPLAAIARSAGAAADRLAADADVDNEVYRAWKEMTDHLELDNPEARTPGEFRAAALEAGMAAADVDALTELFEAVRYGGSAPTEQREARAREALRRIERRYGGRSE